MNRTELQTSRGRLSRRDFLGGTTGAVGLGLTLGEIGRASCRERV